MYLIGMNTRDIQCHLHQVYGVEVPAETISNITVAVMVDGREVFFLWCLIKRYTKCAIINL